MRCLLLASLLVLASAGLPSPGPFDSVPKDLIYDINDPPPVPFSMFDAPLNATLEDGSYKELFEGDIVLTEEQRLNRKGLVTNTWTNGIVPFVITSSSSRDRGAILAGISHWRQATCVTFVEKPESYSSGPHVRFIRSKGCWSYLGMIKRNNGQAISIGDGCASLGIIAHEIGHAIGFFHEQSRRDRNSHVMVLFENIYGDRERNFRIGKSERSLGVQYDLTSVMHYGSFSFSKNGMPTIVTNDIALSGLIGQRGGLTHRDKQLANLMYNCDKSCRCPPVCRNGGYLTSRCQCACPPGTSGSRCEITTGTYYGTICGDQDITRPGTITSPNYPQLYPPGKHCVWIVTAPAGKRVRIQFGTVKVIFRHLSRCYWDWINLHIDRDQVADHMKCGTELQNKAFISEGNRLAVELHSYVRSYPHLQTGFTANITFV